MTKQKYRLTLGNFNKMIIKRQIEKQSDTLIIIYGLPRTGKTTLGFKILEPFLKEMKRLHKEGKSDWNVPRYWKQIFNDYFSSSAEEMNRKATKNPERSFSFIDEGNDILSWFNQMEREQQDLIKLLLKIGKKKMLSIIIIPNLSLLTKSILSRAKYLFLVPDEPTPKGNYAHILRNFDNPILAENKPFGLKDIINRVLKHPFLGQKENFEIFISGNDRYVGKIHYGSLDPKLYKIYDKLVKEPSLLKSDQKRKMVSSEKFNKLQYTFDTLLYNLKNRDSKSISQIKSLFVDKFGVSLASYELIRNHIDRMMGMENRPNMQDEEIMKDIKDKIKNVEDVEVELT